MILDNQEERTGLARWIILALLISLLLHVAFGIFAWNYHLSPFLSEQITPTEEPLPFQVQEVQLPPSKITIEPEITRPAMAPETIKPPKEEFSAGKISPPEPSTTNLPSLAESILSEKPGISETMTPPPSDSIPAIESLDSHLLQTATAPTHSTTEFSSVGSDSTSGQKNATQPGNKDSGGALQGYSNLDDLLAQVGPLQSEVAPIMMPADLLFAFDDANLLPAASVNLDKLATLIQRNPSARFIIEGYTDSTGSADYNQALSERRAESVKQRLVESMQIDAARIKTKGLGATKFLVSKDLPEEQQQPNRRVEIVILP